MPYSRQAKYRHFRLHDPRSFSRIRTVSIYKTNYKGKWRKPGVKARAGYNKYRHKWMIQSLLVPKKYFR